jgi:hypothetical protein
VALTRKRPILENSALNEFRKPVITTAQSISACGTLSDCSYRPACTMLQLAIKLYTATATQQGTKIASLPLAISRRMSSNCYMASMRYCTSTQPLRHFANSTDFPLWRLRRSTNSKTTTSTSTTACRHCEEIVATSTLPVVSPPDAVLSLK